MAFPSKQFYHNKLQLGNSNEQSLPSRLTFWPAGPHYPLVFLHCVGKEEKTVVTTDESAEMSCKNETEADYAVISCILTEPKLFIPFASVTVDDYLETFDPKL